jgi:hypothetical protein
MVGLLGVRVKPTPAEGSQSIRKIPPVATSPVVRGSFLLTPRSGEQ